jgi:hypothetical protein
VGGVCLAAALQGLAHQSGTWGLVVPAGLGTAVGRVNPGVAAAAAAQVYTYLSWVILKTGCAGQGWG